jgi:hypothetical protein
MPIQSTSPTPPELPFSDLADYDLPSAMVQPFLRAFRYVNTAADALFYDVELLWLRLYTRGLLLSTDMTKPFAAAQDRLAAWQAAAKFVNLSALADPEGTILVVDAHQAPYVRTYSDVSEFLADGLEFPAPQHSPGVTPNSVNTIAITGVGSSALGSAAFAWNVSEGLHRPVAAIVPGYGLADVIPQALGGWFGFGVHDYLQRMLQQALTEVAPRLAAVGHQLSRSSPQAAARQSGGAVFRSGSRESDILHDILSATPQITRLYGHSKGALCIQNAIRELPRERYASLHVTTFGCVIQEETDADYNQVLGGIDALGQLNSWGNWPEQWIASWHTTNTFLPGAMPVVDLVTKDIRAEDPLKIDPAQLRAVFTDVLRELFPANKMNVDIHERN